MCYLTQSLKENQYASFQLEKCLKGKTLQNYHSVMILKLTYWFKTLLSVTQNMFMLSSSKPTSRIHNNFMLSGSKKCFPKFKPIPCYLIQKTAFQN